MIMPVVLNTVVTYILIQLQLLIIIEAGVKFNLTEVSETRLLPSDSKEA